MIVNSIVNSIETNSTVNFAVNYSDGVHGKVHDEVGGSDVVYDEVYEVVGPEEDMLETVEETEVGHCLSDRMLPVTRYTRCHRLFSLDTHPVQMIPDSLTMSPKFTIVLVTLLVIFRCAPTHAQQKFHLKSDETGQVYGPFELVNSNKVAIGENTLTIVMPEKPKSPAKQPSLCPPY